MAPLLSTFGAASARGFGSGLGGGFVDAQVGARTTITNGGTISLAHVIELANTNYFLVAAIHSSKSTRIHLLSVNPSTLAVTYHDSMSIRQAYDNNYGVGVAADLSYTDYNGLHNVTTAMLDSSGDFYYHKIGVDPANNAISQIGSNRNVGNWSSGYDRPLKNCNYFKYSQAGPRGYFAEFTAIPQGEVKVRYLESTSTTSNSITAYTRGGTNRYVDRDESSIVFRHPNQINVFYIAGSDTSSRPTVKTVYSVTTNSWAGKDTYDQPWGSNTGNAFIGMGLDTVNSTGASGNNQYVHLTKNWNNTSGTGLIIFETNNSANNYYNNNGQNGSIFNVSQRTSSEFTQTHRQDNGGMCGVSGNWCGGVGVYNGGTSYKFMLDQWVYNPNDGWVEVLNLIDDSGPNGSAYRANGETVGYNSNAGVNLCVYRDIYQSQWYARAFIGKHKP